MGYGYDRREARHWWQGRLGRFDEARMVFELDWDAVGFDCEGETFDTLPAVYEVCGTCDGKGKHVNPSIDAHGLSRDDFDQDPDFADDYFSGLYDVPCNECHGRRVAPVVDEAKADRAILARLNAWLDDEAAYAAACAAERRMGA